jgi:hypothetical protein
MRMPTNERPNNSLQMCEEMKSVLVHVVSHYLFTTIRKANIISARGKQQSTMKSSDNVRSMHGI